MLGKRQRSMIGKLSQLLVSGSWASQLFEAGGTSQIPRGPLDLMTHSPRGLKGYELGGGVGLGIVAAMEKSICNPKRSVNRRPRKVMVSDRNDDLEEDYTYVTSYNGPNCDKPFMMVYYNGMIEYCSSGSGLGESRPSQRDPRASFPTSEFLSSCHSCGKKLQGEDIYMYRGEKAFCSIECRSSQIMIDERKERCRPEASRSVNLSSSPYSEGQIFSAGILAI